MNTTIAPGDSSSTPSAEEIAAAVRILTAAWAPTTTTTTAPDDAEDDADLGDECGCGGAYDDAEDDPGSGIIPKCTCAPGCSCDLCGQDDYDRAARCTAAITDPVGGYPRGCGRPSRLEVTAWQTSRITGLDPDHATQCTKELHHACDDRADVELGHRPHERQAGTACSMAHARQIGEQLPGHEQRAGGGGWHIRTYTHLPYRSSLPDALNGLISHTELAKLAAHTVWERIARSTDAAATLVWARQHIAAAARHAAQLKPADLTPADLAPADDDAGNGAR
jgi:hypothetical protein